MNTNIFKRGYRGEDTKQKILEIIAESEPDGKTSGELVKNTGLHRDSIRLACNSLTRENLIVRSGGKLGKYHLVSKIFEEDPGLNAFLSGTAITNKFYELTEYPTCINNIFCNTIFCQEKWKSEDYDNPDNLVDEVYIFEFALRLGAVIIYQLIQAVRFSQLHKYSTTAENNLLIKYIENAVRPLLLIRIFRKLFPVSRRLNTDSDEGLTLFLDLQDNKLDDLMRIFRNTFPDLFVGLENIRTDEIPKQIEWRKHDFYQQLERKKRLEKEDPDHTKCNGPLVPDIKTNIKGRKVRRCSKCHRWIEVRRMRGKTAEQKNG